MEHSVALSIMFEILRCKQTAKDLAEEFGLELPKTFKKSENSKDLKEQMINANARAVEFYSNRLLKEDTKSAEAVLKYLSKLRLYFEKFFVFIRISITEITRPLLNLLNQDFIFDKIVLQINFYLSLRC